MQVVTVNDTSRNFAARERHCEWVESLVGGILDRSSILLDAVKTSLHSNLGTSIAEVLDEI